jgi:hypothetical protein
MATAATQLRERVSFRLDQTQTVTLDGPGIEQAGRSGPEYRYFVQGHAIMWVPAEVHQAIIGHGRSFPAQFEITKHKNGWETVHVEDEPGQAHGYGQASPVRPAQPQPAPRGPLATAQEQLPAARGTMPSEQPYSASMYTALCAAIRTASAAEKFAQEIGHPVAFDTSDIRTIAATLFIHATRSSQ